MSTTGTSLATEALEELGAITPGDPITTAETAKCLAVMNRMIASQNIRRGNIFSSRVDTWTLVNGQQSYTVGPGGNFDTGSGRPPVELSRVNLLMPSGSLTVRRKIDILTEEQWQRKAVQSIRGLPVEIYSDNDNPLTHWFIYQIPDRAWQIETYMWQQFAPLTALSDTILIPQGYEDYWTYEMVMRLAGPFARQPSATTVALYQAAKEAVMAMNAISPSMRLDGDVPSSGPGGAMYNWRAGLMDGDE